MCKISDCIAAALIVMEDMNWKCMIFFKVFSSTKLKMGKEKEIRQRHCSSVKVAVKGEEKGLRKSSKIDL